MDFKGAEKAAVEALYSELFINSHYTRQDFYLSWCEIGEVHFKRYLQREITFEEQRINRMTELYRTIGENISDKAANEVFELYIDYFEENWYPFNDVILCLESLSGNRLGIITNGDEEQQRKKLRKIGIIDYFDVIVTSSRAGKSKPDPIIFEYACQEAGCSPEESLYVGDDLKVAHSRVSIL